jgi:hypothetical protein
MATTTNYGWTTPNDSDPFKNGASAIRTLGSAIDTTTFSLGQGVKSYVRNTTAALALTTTTETALMNSPSFTPIAGRLYEITVSVGYVQKTTAVGNINIRLRKDSTSGTILDDVLYSAQTVSSIWMHTKTFLATSTHLGTSAFVPTVTVQVNGNGATVQNTATQVGSIIIKDIGPS